MSALVFDSGPIISLSMNNLLIVLRELKAQYKDGSFYITESVRRELVERPLTTRRFKFEALQILSEIYSGTLSVMPHKEIREKAMSLLNTANHIFKAKGNWINIVHYAEMETIAAAIFIKAEAVAIDERTSRLILENPRALQHILEEKLHMKVDTDLQSIRRIQAETKGLRVIRSSELVAIAYEKGLFSKYFSKQEIEDIPNIKRMLLEAVLWGVKLNGCSISENEIEQLLKIEKY